MLCSYLASQTGASILRYARKKTIDCLDIYLLNCYNTIIGEFEMTAHLTLYVIPTVQNWNYNVVINRTRCLGWECGGDYLVLSVMSTEAACENMPGFLCICNVTSESLFLQSSTTPGRGCWGSLPLQGQTLGLPGEWRHVDMKKTTLRFSSPLL